MGLFSSSSPFDSCVERATSEKNTSDDWAQIMDVCDKVKETPNGSKDCLKSITKRLSNDNPRVVLQTITLLDACINNCGRKFLLEVAGREFEQELLKLITSTKTHIKVSTTLRESLKRWAEGEFKKDPELSLIPALYTKLQKDGYEFDIHTDSPKKTVKYSNDPNVVNSAQEEEDIAKAIQLSLQEPGSSSFKSGFQGNKSGSSGLYSSASAVLASDVVASVPEKEPMKVRAVYDFEAAEDNELTFKAGEIIIILDNSDANWWKGANHRGEGLFPANFVTTDLEEEPSYKNESSGGSTKRVLFNDTVEVAQLEDTPAEDTEEVTGEIDEDKIDHLLHLLHEADPTGDRADDPSLPVLEEQVNAMAPSIDAELECIDKKHAQLARISTDLVDALNLYHQLMREMPASMTYFPPYGKLMANTMPGQQGMLPPQYLLSNPENMPPHSMYQPNHFPPYVGPLVSGMHQYMPPHMVPPGAAPPPHMVSPSHHSGTSQLPSTSNYQAAPHNTHGGMNTMPNFSQFNQGLPSEFGGITTDNVASMAPSSQAPVNTQTTAALLPPHAFPPQGHPMSLPSLQGQGSMAQQVAMMSLPPQGPSQGVHQGLPPPQQDPQGPPHQGLPPPQPPTHGLPQDLPPQALPSSMPHQGPPSSLPYQGPPTSMNFYSQPQMQQPLL